MIKIQILNNNGGVTKLINLESIVNTLNANLKEVLTFIKKKLNTTIIEKDLIIKKVETVEKIEEILEEYIKNKRFLVEVISEYKRESI